MCFLIFVIKSQKREPSRELFIYNQVESWFLGFSLIKIIPVIKTNYLIPQL